MNCQCIFCTLRIFYLFEACGAVDRDIESLRFQVSIVRR